MGYAYNPNGGWTATHQMSINGKFDGISREDLIVFARQNNIKDAETIIDEVREASARWPQIAKACGIPQEMVDRIKGNMLL